MNYTPERARHLVANALESGEYDQGTSALFCPHTCQYSCLGIATIIFMQHETHSIRFGKVDDGLKFISYNDASDIRLLLEVQKWLEFRYCNGGYMSRKSLAGHNNQGMPFNELAKLFRNPPRGLILEGSSALDYLYIQ